MYLSIMNVLNLFVNSYSKLKNYGMPFWLMTPARRFVRKIAFRYLPSYLNRPAIRSSNHCEGLIVSFTSFPARINDVWQVVECMKRQSLLPEKIILWLSKDNFPTSESIPQSLWDRVDDLFTINLVDGDIRSHKKYYYASKEYPNKMIFLIDDDIYYDTDILNRSVKEYKIRGKKSIICNYGYQIKFNSVECLPYSRWQAIDCKKIGKDLFFGSGGGTLFCPAEMYKDLTNINLALQLTPLADDIWLNSMALKAGLVKVILPNGPLLTVDIEDNVTLSSVNNGLGRNDEQIRAIKKYYGDIFNNPQDSDNVY